MQTKIRQLSGRDPSPGARRAPLLAPALRDTFRAGYRMADLRADARAGIVVGIVALPLSMALAIASGMRPEIGLYTAIFAGGTIALLTGSRVSVSGPTAAFVVLLAPIAEVHGPQALILASFMAGAMLLAMGLMRLGRLIQYIPHPVTTGFTAGIAVVIATLQVRDLLGLPELPNGLEHYWDRVAALLERLPGLDLADLAIGVLSLALLLVSPRVTKTVPAPLIAVVGGALAAAAAATWFPERFGGIETLGTRFGEFGSAFPIPALPWAGLDPSAATFQELLRDSFGIAMLGAIASLLCAVVADGMTGQKHDPDAELVAQGAGNLIAPIFGGIAATGAIARTVTNVKNGGRSPVSAIVHVVFLVLAVLFLGPMLGHLPMASLAALLLVVAWNMADVRHFAHIVRVAPRSDVVVLVVCFLLTVLFDMVIAIGVGVVLAALLFMRRMSELSDVRVVAPAEEVEFKNLPASVLHYEIIGPLFFGAADKAAGAMRTVRSGARVVVLDLNAVPVVDATGLVALESTIKRMQTSGMCVILGGLNRRVRETLDHAGFVEVEGQLRLIDDRRAAVAEAVRLVGASDGSGRPGLAESGSRPGSGRVTGVSKRST